MTVAVVRLWVPSSLGVSFARPDTYLIIQNPMAYAPTTDRKTENKISQVASSWNQVEIAILSPALIPDFRDAQRSDHVGEQ